MAVKLKTGVSARVPVSMQSVPFLQKYFKFNMHDQTVAQTTGSTSPPASAILGVLPAYSVPMQLFVRVNTAFSSGDLKIGTTADLSTMCSTMDLASGTTGLYVIDRYMGTFSTADVTLYCVTATTGAGAGDADIWLTYLPNVYPTTY